MPNCDKFKQLTFDATTGKFEKLLKNKLAALSTRQLTNAYFGHLRLNFWAQVVLGNCKWFKREDTMSIF